MKETLKYPHRPKHSQTGSSVLERGQGLLLHLLPSPVFCPDQRRKAVPPALRLLPSHAEDGHYDFTLALLISHLNGFKPTDTRQSINPIHRWKMSVLGWEQVPSSPAPSDFTIHDSLVIAWNTKRAGCTSCLATSTPHTEKPACQTSARTPNCLRHPPPRHKISLPRPPPPEALMCFAVALSITFVIICFLSLPAHPSTRLPLLLISAASCLPHLLHTEP